MNKSLKSGLIFSLFLLLFLFSYTNQFIYHYQVPPGGDASGHNVIVKTILQGNYAQIWHYHTFWHLIIVAINLITHIRPITIMAWMGPFLLVSCGLSLYYFNRRYFGLTAGITSLILVGFLSTQPIQTLYDGGFPNVLAAGTVLPFVFIALDNVFTRSKKLIHLVIFLLSLVVLFFSHHLTTLYTIPIIISFLIAQLIKTGRERNISWGYILIGLFIFIFGLIGLTGLILHLPSSNSVTGLAKEFLNINWVPPFLHINGKLENPNAFWPISTFPNAIGEAVVYLGCGGFVIALYEVVFKRKNQTWNISALLVIWTYTLLVGSQLLSIGFPVRLARDLAIPLALLGGLFVARIIEFLWQEKNLRLIAYFFIVVCLAIGFQTFKSRYTLAVGPNSLTNHLSVDSQAAQFITQKFPLESRIFLFQDDIYLSEFTPIHLVTHINDEKGIKELISLEGVEHVLSPDSYVYLEERFDREPSWNNNHAIVETYYHSPLFHLVATFEQPEKKVYLFHYLGLGLAPQPE